MARGPARGAATRRADAIRGARSAALDDWGLAGTAPASTAATWPPTQAAVAVLTGHGLGVLSEESGRHHPERAVIVVVDPLDGSTNASRGHAVVRDEPVRGRRRGPAGRAGRQPRRAARRSEPCAGAGATRRRPAAARRRATTAMSESLVGSVGLPAPVARLEPVPRPRRRRARPVRGRAGVLDAYVDCSSNAHGAWDYLGGHARLPRGGRVRRRRRRPRSRHARPRRPPHAGRGRARRRCSTQCARRPSHRSAADAATLSGARVDCTAGRCWCTGACPRRLRRIVVRRVAPVVHRRRDLRHRAGRRPRAARPPSVPRTLGRARRPAQRGEARPTRPGARCSRRSASTIELVGEPAVVVDARPRRVDIVFRARLRRRCRRRPRATRRRPRSSRRWFDRPSCPSCSSRRPRRSRRWRAPATSPPARPLPA